MGRPGDVGPRFGGAHLVGEVGQGIRGAGRVEDPGLQVGQALGAGEDGDLVGPQREGEVALARGPRALARADRDAAASEMMIWNRVQI